MHVWPHVFFARCKFLEVVMYIMRRKEKKEPPEKREKKKKMRRKKKSERQENQPIKSEPNRDENLERALMDTTKVKEIKG